MMREANAISEIRQCQYAANEYAKRKQKLSVRPGGEKDSAEGANRIDCSSSSRFGQNERAR